MLIYSNTIENFSSDVLGGIISEQIEKKFKEVGINHNNERENRAWDNSLMYMNMILSDNEIDKNIKIAIEYQIPLTDKRIDFLITGKDENNNDNVVIVELKQWEKAEKTTKEDLVITYLAKNYRLVTHPSYQAYSYAKTIENFNEAFQKEQISLHPCAFLHNYKEEYRDEICNPIYAKIIEAAPLFLKRDNIKLREFIKRYVRKADNGEILYKIENGRIRPSKVLQDSLANMLKGNKEFVMLDEQKVVFSTIKELVEKATKEGKKYTVIVEGGPGTGKSVVAINLLVELRQYNVNYVTKNQAPREVYFSKLRSNNYKLSFIKTLFKGSGSYIDTEKNTFDCLIVDESHRLNAKSGIFQNKGENQIKEIINASLVSVFFIDEDQIVTLKDIGTVSEIKKWAKKCGSTVIAGDDYILKSQFRCNGNNGYIDFLDNILGIRLNKNYYGFQDNYDFKVFDDPNELRDVLRLKNQENNKARMVAGYCYDWITKNCPHADVYDIVLENGFKAKWNFYTTTTWAIDEDSFEEVGCIHTSQGLEFDYVGVIIGKDLRYENGKVITDYNERAKTDQSLKGINKLKDKLIADKIIRNTYKTLLSRGQKGCYVYCEDKNLSNYIKEQYHIIDKK